MELDYLPDCPICAHRPVWFTGITSVGGEDYMYTGISCPQHLHYFISTSIEYSINSNFPKEKSQEIKNKYSEIVQHMYDDGLNIAERKFLDTVTIPD